MIITPVYTLFMATGTGTHPWHDSLASVHKHARVVAFFGFLRQLRGDASTGDVTPGDDTVGAFAVRSGETGSGAATAAVVEELLARASANDARMTSRRERTSRCWRIRSCTSICRGQ